MNDIEHRNYVHEIMTHFRAFKLSRSLFRGKYSADKNLGHMMNIPDSELQRVIDWEMSKALSEHIYGMAGATIKKTDAGEFNEYEMKLLVMRPEDFLSIVEGAIQFMSEEQLNHIRNGS